MCANSCIRGVYTSDNLYDFVTLPPDLRFKFSFEISRWPEYFAWLELPQDLSVSQSERALADERAQQLKAKAALKAQNQIAHMTAHQRELMEKEVNLLLQQKKIETDEVDTEIPVVDKAARYAAMQAEMNNMIGGKPHEGSDLLDENEQMGFGSPSGIISEKMFNAGPGMNLKGASSGDIAYHAGQFSG